MNNNSICNIPLSIDSPRNLKKKKSSLYSLLELNGCVVCCCCSNNFHMCNTMYAVRALLSLRLSSVVSAVLTETERMFEVENWKRLYFMNSNYIRKSNLPSFPKWLWCALCMFKDYPAVGLNVVPVRALLDGPFRPNRTYPPWQVPEFQKYISEDLEGSEYIL